MVDTVEEIAKVAVVTDDLMFGTEVTLFTTGADERAVIKDIQLDGLFVPMRLTVNDFPITTLSGNMSGSEIIGPNSTIKIAAIPTWTGKDATFQWLQESNDLAIFRKVQTFGEAGVGASVVSADITADASGATGSDQYQATYLDPTGTFYTHATWDGNISSQVRKMEVGVGLSQTGTVASYSVLAGFSDDGYVYWNQGGNLRRMTTNTDAAEEVIPTAMTGYPSAAYPSFGTNWQTSPDGKRCFIWTDHQSSGIIRVRFVNQSDMSFIEEYQIGSTSSNTLMNRAPQMVQPFYDTEDAQWKITVRGNGTSYHNGTLAIPANGGGNPPFLADTSADTSGYYPNAKTPITVWNNRIYWLDELTGQIRSFNSVWEDMRDELSDPTLVASAGEYYPRQVFVTTSVPDNPTLLARDYVPEFVDGTIRITGVKSV